VEVLVEPLAQCTALKSICLEHMGCDSGVWSRLMGALVPICTTTPTTECLDGRVSGITVMIRQVQIRTDPEAEWDAGPCHLVSSLLNILPGISELHLVDCDLTADALQILLLDRTQSSTNIANTSLRLLSLEGNTSIGTVGLQYLGSALVRFPGLETLSIERVGASQTGLLVFLDSIQPHPNIRCLNLMANSITQPTIERLERLVSQENFLLQRVLWSSTSGSGKSTAPAQASSIYFWLQVNRVGRQFLWRTQQVPPTLWARFLESIIVRGTSNVDVLYYFIRSHPGLMVRC
jgi:hypothetical protein